MDPTSATVETSKVEWFLLDAQCAPSPAYSLRDKGQVPFDPSNGPFQSFELLIESIHGRSRPLESACLLACHARARAPLALTNDELSFLEFSQHNALCAIPDSNGETCLVLGVCTSSFTVSGRDCASRAKVEGTSSQFQVGYQGPQLDIQENPDATLGAHLWHCSLVLAYRLIHSDYFAPGRLDSRGIIELGAGCGLVSFVCSLLYPTAQVIATDLPDVVQDSTQPNLVRFQQRHKAPSQRVSLSPLEWTESPIIPPIRQPKVTVLACDVLYNTHSHSALLSTLLALFERSATTPVPDSVEAIIAYKRRATGDDAFFNLARERGLHVSHVDELSFAGVEVYRFVSGQ